MELIHSDFFPSLAAIVLLDLVLAGDNAIVIALAARRLPIQLQRKAIFWGTFGAIGVRIALTGIVVWLLKLPGLMLGGGILLLPIAVKLLVPEPEGEHRIGPADSFWAALRTIIVADALMGLDNVLAIAGASRGHMGLVVLGLLISVPLVVWGSTLILRLIGRFPIIVYVGSAAIAWTAARMIAHDRWLLPWFEAHPWAPYTLDALLVSTVCGIGWWMAIRERKARARSDK